MVKKKSSRIDTKKIRERAEQIVRSGGRDISLIDKVDIANLQQELEISRVELEIQNEVLREIQEQLQESQDKYQDLYDYSPSGYFTINRHTNNIVEVNLKGCALLGIERSRLLETSFTLYIDPQYEDTFYFCRTKAIEGHVTVRCELKMRGSDGKTFWADLEMSVREGDQHVRIDMIDVSERKNREEQIEFQAKLLGAVGESVIAIDPAGQIIYWGDGAVNTYGWQAHEVMGKNISEFIGALIKAEESKEIMQSLAEGEPWSGEYLVRRRDGTEFPVLSNTMPVKDEKGSVIAFISLSHDISDLKKREDDLMIKNFAIASALAGIGLSDLSGKLTYVNPALLKMWGYQDEKEILGKSAFSFIKGGSEVEEIFKEAVDKDLWEGELQGNRKDGSVFDVYVTTNLVRDKRNVPLYIMASFLDITERKKADEFLKESEEHFRALTENAYDVVLVIDNTGGATYISPSLKRTLGYEPEEISGKGNLFELIHPENIQRVAEEFEEAIVTPGKSKSMELRVKHKDGSWRYIEGTGTNLLDHPSVRGLVCNFHDITERRMADEALKESEERFRTLVQVSSEAVFQMNADWTEILSLVHRDFILDTSQPTETWLKYVHPDDLPLVQATVSKAISTRGTTELEHRVLHVDGSPGWVSSWAIPIFNDEGEITGWFGMASDITERKNAEEALVESESRAKALIKYAPAGIWEFDYRVPKILSVNDAICHLSGYSRKELLAMNPGEVLDEPSRQLFADRIKRQLTGEKLDDTVEFRIKKKDGSFIYMNLNVAFSKDKPHTALVIGHDITERLKMEDALRASETKYRDLFESIDEGFCIAEVLFDEQGKPVDYRFVDVNSAFEGQTGLHNVEGRRMKELAPNFEEYWYEIFGRIALTGQPERFINVARYLGGRWFDVYSFPAGRPEEHKVAILFRDITELKRAEQMKDEFLSLVSHELRTPLAIISGSLKVALDEQASEDEAKELIQSAAENADILANLLENMLELTRYQTGRLQIIAEPVDIHHLVSRVISKIKKYGATQEFQVEIPGDLPPIQADPVRIERVFHNLVDNAVKFSPKASLINIRAYKEGAFLIISVVDQGVGISSEDQENLFQIFSRVGKTATTTGTGLGLVVCQRLLEAHGGWIKVESAPGKGSTFSFGLPVLSEN